MLNYFNFNKIGNDYLITNDFGRYLFLSEKEFIKTIKEEYQDDPDLSDKLQSEGFAYFDTPMNFSYRSRYDLQNSKSYLFKATQLHIFVVTTACNHQCIYCQAQNGYEIPDAVMSSETAKKAVDVALSVPGNSIDIEFQGGEPLMNFDIIRLIIEYAEKNKKEKEIQFSIVSNLALLTDEMILYLKEHNVTISTSLDGDMLLHTSNRPMRNGKNLFNDICNKINILQKEKMLSGALLTTTRNSLTRYESIVDQYIELGLHTISLRPLTPLGCADKNWRRIGYTPDEFLDFYIKALNYILDVNRKGYFLIEGTARLLLTKILNHEGVNYMELRSPCGASMGQMAYYCDGNVYTCDEGRMLAEMGNPAFKLGNLETDNYDTLMNTRVCKNVCSASILESIPSCCDCAYQPYCGTCPVVTYALDNDIYEKRPNGYKCSINKGILDWIFKTIKENDPVTIATFRSWIN